jgi:hypothetical protein
MEATHLIPPLLPVFKVLSHPLARLNTLITLPRQEGPITSHVKEVFLDECTANAVRVS